MFLLSGKGILLNLPFNVKDKAAYIWFVLRGIRRCNIVDLGSSVISTERRDLVLYRTVKISPCGRNDKLWV